MTDKTDSPEDEVLSAAERRNEIADEFQSGTKLLCRVEGDSLVPTPEQQTTKQGRLVTDKNTGLRITQSPPGTKVTSDDVRAALADFP